MTLFFVIFFSYSPFLEIIALFNPTEFFLVAIQKKKRFFFYVCNQLYKTEKKKEKKRKQKKESQRQRRRKKKKKRITKLGLSPFVCLLLYFLLFSFERKAFKSKEHEDTIFNCFIRIVISPILSWLVCVCVCASCRLRACQELTLVYSQNNGGSFFFLNIHTYFAFL